jgi:hypothetical protein
MNGRVPTDFLERIESMTRYLREIQLPLSDEERTALASLYAQLIALLETWSL